MNIISTDKAIYNIHRIKLINITINKKFYLKEEYLKMKAYNHYLK